MDIEGSPNLNAPTTLTAVFGQKIGDLPKPTLDGYVFEGWYTDKTFSTEVNEDYMIESEDYMTLHAKWRKVINPISIMELIIYCSIAIVVVFTIIIIIIIVRKEKRKDRFNMEL